MDHYLNRSIYVNLNNDPILQHVQAGRRLLSQEIQIEAQELRVKEVREAWLGRPNEWRACMKVYMVWLVCIYIYIYISIYAYNCIYIYISAWCFLNYPSEK